MRHISLIALSLLCLVGLNACEGAATAIPEHRVTVLTDPETGKQVAISKPCPDWNYHFGDGLENQLPQNFNCAQQYNLGKMIVEPHDLLQGRTPGDADANPGVLGVERYRQDKKKELISPKEISGAASR
jgi:hypothetical protein